MGKRGNCKALNIQVSPGGKENTVCEGVGVDTPSTAKTKKRRIIKRPRPDFLTKEELLVKLIRITDEHPALKNIIDKNQELKSQIACEKIKRNMVKEQLITIKKDLTFALAEVKRLEKLLDTVC